MLVVAEWDFRNLCHQFKIFMVFSKFPEHFLRNLCHILTIYAIKTDIVQTETTMIWFVNAAFLLIISRTNITSPSPHKLWVWFCSISFFQGMRVFRKINWEQSAVFAYIILTLFTMPRVFPEKNEEIIMLSPPITTKNQQICMIFRSVKEYYLGPVQTSMMELLCQNG